MVVIKGKTCPKCGDKKFYRIRRGKKRCSKCNYETRKEPRIGNLNLSKREWERIIFWFVLDQPILGIVEQTGLSRYSVSKAVYVLRQVMILDVPGVFSGTVEVDETYLGGRKRNKRKSQLIKEKELFGKESKSGFGTTKQPVFGILCRSGKVWAEVVDKTEARDLIPLITRQVERGTTVCSDTWRAYTGLALRGYVHRLVKHREKEYVSKTDKKNHINGLEGFWGYLKRKLAAKGGVRRKHLHLFLGEYVWRYNHRGLEANEKIDRLLNLVIKFSG